MERNDLTGRRFGSLTAVSYTPGKGWLCTCDCGGSKVVRTTYLTRGVVTSCGCHKYRGEAKHRTYGTTPGIDYTGRTFGCLTGVRFLGGGSWLWQCSCGTEKAIRAASVVSGKIVSCGHVLRETVAQRRDQLFDYRDGTCINSIRSICNGTRPVKAESGHMGIRVNENKAYRTYTARITFQGKSISLGTFGTLDAAIKARKDAELKYFWHEVMKAEAEKEDTK